MCLLARPKARSASISLWTARKASAGTLVLDVLVKMGQTIQHFEQMKAFRREGAKG